MLNKGSTLALALPLQYCTNLHSRMRIRMTEKYLQRAISTPDDEGVSTNASFSFYTTISSRTTVIIKNTVYLIKMNSSRGRSNSSFAIRYKSVATHLLVGAACFYAGIGVGVRVGFIDCSDICRKQEMRLAGMRGDEGSGRTLIDNNDPLKTTAETRQMSLPVVDQ